MIALFLAINLTNFAICLNGEKMKYAQNRDLPSKRILDEVMGQQHRKELELYKLYVRNESFYQALFDTMKSIVDMPRL
jgi:type I restriction enzyme, R subunit